jgi:quercetin dioxygenase-like cupin family protein
MNTTPFVAMSALPTKEIFNGLIRGQYVHAERMTLGLVNLKPNTDLPMHQHPHEQLTYVVSGRFEFTVGSKTTVLEAGMCAVIPGNVMHGGRTITACEVIDVFSPVREDYR